MQRLILVAVILFAGSAPARAQSGLDRIKLALGDRVDVTDSAGVTTSGVLTDVTDTLVQAGNREIPFDTVLKIDRRGDSLWDGFLIGAGIGLLLSPIAEEGCLSGSKVPCVITPMLVYGGIGALIDMAHEGKTTIYRASRPRGKGARLAPFVAPGASGMVLALGF